ncbi:hypothetical protein M2271_003901 [Streptomyces sp. LBL]|uniref:hypothetical protein n=1 Tax=Streptomyces sp. LBL TaxID=2940562 RepID=UPI002473246A|nr:hypothetical protein [Streptomyces sp. LBL]MDH6626084.1 hypothetical protein [Streptomyces sp. LBL]
MSRRVRFPAPEDLAPEPEAVPAVGPVAFTAVFSGGVERCYDFSALACPRLVRHLARALAGLAGVENRHKYVGTTDSYAHTLTEFVTHLAQATDMSGDMDLEDLLPEYLDSFEAILAARYGESSTTPYLRMQQVVKLLRLVQEEHPDRLGMAMQARLGFTTVQVGQGRGRPLDAYPDALFEGVQAAALADVRAARDRMLTGEQLATAGRDPVGGGWHGWTRENAAWHIAHRGPLTGALRAERGAMDKITELGGIGRLNSHFFLTAHDVLAFVVLLMCQTGLEPEAACRLSANCLINPARGYVSIAYVKNRSHGQSRKTLRVTDGGAVHQPGGLIRLAVRLTAHGRRLAATDLLWAHALRSGEVIATFGRHRATSLGPVKQAFLERHQLTALFEASGEEASLNLRRLRKTYKSRRYQQTGGVLEDFAEGHSPRVAAKHYADIEAHRPLHEEAVEKGLREALDAAMEAPVVLDDQGRRLDRSAAELPPDEVAVALSGDSDVWLASCRDFHASPFARRPGSGCPVAVWGCLECPNAVFATRHLPAILSFAAFLTAQREAMTVLEWNARYALAWERIITGILPQFTGEQQATARLIAEGHDAALHLPGQILQGLT